MNSRLLACATTVVACLASSVGCESSMPATDAGAVDAASSVDAATSVDAVVAPDADFDAGPVRGTQYGEPGEHPVGHVRVMMLDRTGERTLPVELWYPAAESARADAEAGESLAAFETGTANETAMASLLAAAPASCVRELTHAASNADSAELDTYPAVVFSHCHACMRFDVAEVSERLASHGIVVAAPDHLGNTAWDATPAPVSAEFLAVRASDVSSVLDRLLDPDAAELPSFVRGHIDSSRVAVMGHSYGAATTGAVVATDSRFVAALAIAAPIRLLAGISASDVRVPYLFLLATDDNSIGAAGNSLIRGDYAALETPAWLLEVEHAGHWSFTDILGLDERFAAGCSAIDGRAEYIDPQLGREIAADAAMAFFGWTLLGDEDARDFLARGFAGQPVAVSSHE